MSAGGVVLLWIPAAGWLRQLAAPPVAGTRPVVAAGYPPASTSARQPARALLDTHLDLARFRASSVPLGAARLQRLVRHRRARALRWRPRATSTPPRVRAKPDERPGDLRLVVGPAPHPRGRHAARPGTFGRHCRNQTNRSRAADGAATAWSARRRRLRPGRLERRQGCHPAAPARGWLSTGALGRTRADVDPGPPRPSSACACSPACARGSAAALKGWSATARRRPAPGRHQAATATWSPACSTSRAPGQDPALRRRTRAAAAGRARARWPLPRLGQPARAPQQQATTSVGYHANAGSAWGWSGLNRQPLGLPFARPQAGAGAQSCAPPSSSSAPPRRKTTRRLASMQYEQDRSGDQISTSLGLRLGWLRGLPTTNGSP